MFATINRNFILFLGLVFANIAISNPNPFMSEFQVEHQGRSTKYPILNHKYIISYDAAKSLNLTGKNTKILVIDGSNDHSSKVISLINNSVCGIAPDAQVVLKQHIFYKGHIDESLPAIIKEGCNEGVDFISISFSDMFREFHDTWKEAFLEAKSKGIGILMSAGNDGKSLDIMYPGINTFLEEMNRSFLFVLASEYESETEKLAKFSNYPDQNGGSISYCITSPGDSILSKDMRNNYRYFCGTSAATPLVAAAAALVKEANPSFTSQQVLDILFKSTRKKRLDIDKNKQDHKEIRLLDLKGALNFKSE